VTAVADTQRPIVLLIEEDPDTLDMYEVGLAGAGFCPVPAHDATTVAGQLDAIHPAVVVTDLRLSRTNGWHTLETLGVRAHACHIPVVLLTGYHDARVDQRAHELGCAAVLRKPCTPADLADVLRSVLTGS
jgi:DNA-binding response OmpR family regulator